MGVGLGGRDKAREIDASHRPVGSEYSLQENSYAVTVRGKAGAVGVNTSAPVLETHERGPDVREDEKGVA